MSGEGERTEALRGTYAFVVNVSKLVDAHSFTPATGTKSDFAQPAVGPLIIASAREAQVELDETRVPDPFGRGLHDCDRERKPCVLMKKSYKMLPKTNTKP
jgi:hypothetical protein